MQKNVKDLYLLYIETEKYEEAKRIIESELLKDINDPEALLCAAALDAYPKSLERDELDINSVFSYIERAKTQTEFSYTTLIHIINVYKTAFLSCVQRFWNFHTYTNISMQNLKKLLDIAREYDSKQIAEKSNEIAKELLEIMKGRNEFSSKECRRLRSIAYNYSRKLSDYAPFIQTVDSIVFRERGNFELASFITSITTDSKIFLDCFEPVMKAEEVATEIPLSVDFPAISTNGERKKYSYSRINDKWFVALKDCKAKIMERATKDRLSYNNDSNLDEKIKILMNFDSYLNKREEESKIISGRINYYLSLPAANKLKYKQFKKEKKSYIKINGKDKYKNELSKLKAECKKVYTKEIDKLKESYNPIPTLNTLEQKFDFFYYNFLK